MEPEASALIDAPRAPRRGEELDLARLGPWLRSALGAAPDAPIAVEQFPGGHSNLTYAVTVGDRGGDPAGIRSVVLRRPPFGSRVKSAHDMGREVRVLSRLSPVYPRAPRPLAFCEDESILGARFYVMERLSGIILRRDLPAGLAIDPRRLCESLIDTLVELHGIDWRAAGLAELGNPDGYVERQVTGWTRRYADAQTHDVPEMGAVSAWLAARLPGLRSPPPTIVHNDYKFDNLVLDPADPARVIGILDWEMTTIGDPLMDLGTSLCYWVEPADPEGLRKLRMGPTSAPGMMTRRELADRYAAASGRPLEQIVFYYCFGLYKTAVVLQQIYYRFVKGLTQDARFGTLGDGVRALAQQAAAYLDRPGL